jgi:Zn-dependent protease with chaperone function
MSGKHRTPLLTIVLLSVLLVGFYLGLALLAVALPIAIALAVARGEYGNYLLVLVGGIYFFYGVLTILLIRFRAYEGIIQQRTDSPELFSLIEAVCAQVDAPCAKLVRFVPGATIDVSEEESILLVPFVSRKALNIGVGILQSLTVTEFQAILAHEFAHFSRRVPVAYRLRHRVKQALFKYGGYTDRLFSEWNERIPGAGCGMVLLLPVTLSFRLFAGIFLFIAQSFARDEELAADRMAALAYGSDTLATALKKGMVESSLFEGNLPRMVFFMAKMNYEPENLYQRYRAFRDQVNGDTIRQIWNKLEQEQPARSDMYPSISERLEHLRSVGIAPEKDLGGIGRPDGLAVATLSEDQRTVREIIDNAEEIEKRLSRKLLASAQHVEAQMRPQPRRIHSQLFRTLAAGRVRWVVFFAIFIMSGIVVTMVSFFTDAEFEKWHLNLISSVTGFLALLFLLMTRKRR